MRAHRARTFLLAGGSAIALAATTAGTALARTPNPLATGFAGYQAQPADGMSSAGTTFTVPHVTCTGLPDSDYLLGEVAGDSVNQEVAAVEVQCFGGAAFESVRVSVDTTGGTTFPVAPGDGIVATEEIAPMGAVAQVADTTTGDTSTAHVTDTTGLDDLGVSIGLLNVSGAPVPHFHTVSFHATQVNGERLAQLRPNVFDMRNPPDTRRVVTTTRLASPFAQGFSVVFKHSS